MKKCLKWQFFGLISRLIPLGESVRRSVLASRVALEVRLGRVVPEVLVVPWNLADHSVQAFPYDHFCLGRRLVLIDHSYQAVPVNP